MQLTLFLIICFISISRSVPGQDNPNPNTQIDNFLQNEMNDKRLPGLSTVIIKNGEVVWIESYGFAGIENNIKVEDSTVFLLASISKVFTGTAIMQLTEKELLKIDEDINNHLHWPIDIPGHASDSITFRKLMTHSASIQDNEDALDTYYDYPDPSISLSKAILRYFSTNGADYNVNKNFFSNAPGTRYEYSNIATALNGYMGKVVSKMPFDQYCDLNIFEPLQMTKTAWFMADFNPSHMALPYRYESGNYVAHPHYGFADYPDGQLRSNVQDLSNFMIAYLNGGNFESNKILSSSSIQEMMSSQLPSLEPTQGLNWYQEEISHNGGFSMLWGHNGSEDGVSTDMYLDLDNEIGVCVLSNGEGNALLIASKLYEYALTLNTTTADVNLDIAELTLSPKPATGYFTIRGITDNYYIQILNINGIVYQNINSSGDITVDLSDLPSGQFVCWIKNKTNNKVWIQLLIKD